MGRHLALALLRVLLAIGIVYALPFSHAQWGASYPGDGQQAVGFVVIFMVIGVMAATLFLVLGSLCQFLLRRRQPWLTLLVDVGLFLVLAGGLAYAGATATYEDSNPVAAHTTNGD
jgi:hypothetical protein